MERPKLTLLNKLPYSLSFLLLVNLSPKDNAVTTINIPVVYSIVLSVTSLKSDVIITPVNTYFATSIRKSANFSCRWFTCGFGGSSNCLFSCGFCGLDFSRRVVINLHRITFLRAKIQHFCEINAESLRFLYPSCLSMSKNSFRGLVSAVRFDARRLNLPKGMGSRRVDV